MTDDYVRDYLDEARRILAKESMMIPSRPHMEAMADFIGDLSHSIQDLLAILQKSYNLSGTDDPAWSVMVKARARQHIAETFEPDYEAPPRCSKCGEEVEEGVKVCRECRQAEKWIAADHRMEEARDRKAGI